MTSLDNKISNLIIEIKGRFVKLLVNFKSL